MGPASQWHRVPLQYCRGTGSHLFITSHMEAKKKKDDSSHLQKMLGSPKIQQILKDQLQTLPSVAPPLPIRAAGVDGFFCPAAPPFLVAAAAALRSRAVVAFSRSCAAVAAKLCSFPHAAGPREMRRERRNTVPRRRSAAAAGGRQRGAGFPGLRINPWWWWPPRESEEKQLGI